jgi:hypothetical protein
MSLWDDFSNAVSSGFDTVADVAETIVTEVGEVIADVVETFGNGGQDVINGVGNFLGGIPGIGGAIKVGFQWFGGVFAGFYNYTGVYIKAFFGIASGNVGGVIRILGSIISLDGDLFIKGLIDIVSGYAGALTLLGAATLSFIQRVIPLQGFERPLTKEELDRLKKVFHNSIAFYNVRVIEGSAGAFSIFVDPTKPSFCTTIANTIYTRDVDLSTNPSALVHECVHVWQYQNLGPRYAAESLAAQSYYGVDDEGNKKAYNWIDELNRGTDKWVNFNKEAQAQLIQDVWNKGSITVENQPKLSGDGVFYTLDEVLDMQGSESATPEFIASDDSDRTAFALESIEILQNKINIRLSHVF